jgi:RimJ/RimL family protein N-acetyltransferase
VVPAMTLTPYASDTQTIETPRLLLREWRDEDLEPFSHMNADERVCEFLGKTFTPEETRAMVERNRADFQEQGFALWALEVKGGAAFIGYTRLGIPSFQAHFTSCVEIGWRLSFEHWGKGYATEAAKAVLNHAFTRLGIDEIVAFTVPKNGRSRAVMEKIVMKHDLHGDFNDPELPANHHLSRNVLYRIRR